MSEKKEKKSYGCKECPFCHYKWELKRPWEQKKWKHCPKCRRDLEHPEKEAKKKEQQKKK